MKVRISAASTVENACGGGGGCCVGGGRPRSCENVIPSAVGLVGVGAGGIVMGGDEVLVGLEVRLRRGLVVWTG